MTRKVLNVKENRNTTGMTANKNSISSKHKRSKCLKRKHSDETSESRKRKSISPIDAADHALLDDQDQTEQRENLQVLEGRLHPFLVNQAKVSFQLEDLTDIQIKAIPAILSKRDVMIKSRTGTGKTLAYCLPLVHMMQEIEPPLVRTDGPVAVILLPTKELSLQTFEVVQKLLKPFIRIVPTCFIGGTNRKHEKDRIRKGVNILIGTPGRIEDHVENTASLELSKVRFVILDEADRMLDMGFQKPMEIILNKIKESSPHSQKILLSATLDANMHWLHTFHMDDPEFIDTDYGALPDANEENIDLGASLPVQLKHFFLTVPFKLRLCALLAFITRKLEKRARRKLIVFFATNDSVMFHHELLDTIINSTDDDARDRIVMTKLHGSMTLEERRKTFANFSAQPSGVLLCTDVAARGLDFKQVTWIVQYNGPQTLVDYVHRSGRTARLNESGKVLTILDPCECLYLNKLSAIGINAKPLSLSMLLKTVAARQKGKSSLRKGQDKNDKLCENYVRDLQCSIEEAVNMSDSLKKLARDAYASFIRSYATYRRDLKPIFHPRNLHLGHVAKSFGLRETPSEIMRACYHPPSIEQQRRQSNHSTTNERLQPAKFDAMSEFACGF